MMTNELMATPVNQLQMPFVLPLYEAESQLRHLVEQTQIKHQPIIFTSGENAQPLAILIEPSLFERLKRQEQQIFHLQLQKLLDLLDNVQNNSLDQEESHKFVQEFSIGVDALNEICPHWQRATYITLKMSSQRLSSENLTDEQVDALRECVKLLRSGLADEEHAVENRQKLIECGLPPMITGNNSIVQMYVDIL